MLNRFLPVAALLAILLFPPGASAQISGIVTTADDVAVESARVFVSGTTFQTTTDASGAFTLPDPGLARVHVVAYAAGQGLQAERIEPASFEGPLHLALDPPEASDGDGSMPDEDQLDYFRDVAFSWTRFSNDIEFENPESLTLHRDGEALEISATTSEPLVVLNPELGYRVIFHDFQLTGTPMGITWSGYPLFIEMTPDRSKDEKKWRKARERAYEGSKRHFLHALAAGNIKDEEWEAYHVRGVGAADDVTPIAEMEKTGFGYDSIAPILREGQSEGTRELMFSGWVHVRYFGGNAENKYTRYMERYWPPSAMRDALVNRPNHTWIMLPFAAATIDPMGYVHKEDGRDPLSVAGYWTFKRLADLLPYDYRPED